MAPTAAEPRKRFDKAAEYRSLIGENAHTVVWVDERSACSLPRGATTSTYDSWHLLHENEVNADSPWSQWILRHLDMANDLSDRTVLEVGCGQGGLTCWLATQRPAASSIVAADISPAAIRLAEEHAEKLGVLGIDWVVADIQHLPYPDASFDTVISCETVEHVPDPLQAVRELARVLKPGGRLFLTTPNYLGVMGLYRIYLRLRSRPFTEGGQPINKLTSIPRTYWWLCRVKLTVETIDGEVHLFPRRGRSPLELEWMKAAPRLTKWVALHSMFVARKPV